MPVLSTSAVAAIAASQAAQAASIAATNRAQAETSSGARTWAIVDLDSPFLETVSGTFEALTPSVRSGAKYAQINSVGRQDPILQFLSGDMKTVDFTARLFARHTADAAAASELLALRSWVEVDPALGRPHVLSLKIGDGHIGLVECVLLSVSETHVDRVQESGAFKGAEVQLRFAKYQSFSVVGGLPTESRYHHVRFGEYYELIAGQEYGDPLVGDRVRARNPRSPLLAVGDIVKLPSRRAIAQDAAGPRSTPFTDAFGKKDTPQRRRFREALAARSADYVSHVQK